MQNRMVVCPKCGAKNRIPSDRDIRGASCGNCQTSLAPPSYPPVVIGIVVVLSILLPNGHRLWKSLAGSNSFVSSGTPSSSTDSPSLPIKPVVDYAPIYRDHLKRIERLLTDEVVNPFTEPDFLWFLYESAGWLNSHSYLNWPDNIQQKRVFREALAQRKEFLQFQELFGFEVAVQSVKDQLRSDVHRIDVAAQTASAERAFANGLESGFNGGQLGASLQSQGATGKQAIFAALGYIALETIVRNVQDSQQLDTAKRQSLDKAKENAQKRLDEIAIKEQVLRQQIQSTVAIEIAGGEAKGVVRRQLDHFLGYLDQGDPNQSIEDGIKQCANTAEQLLLIRRRIPSHPMYNHWRTETAFWSALHLEMMAHCESKDRPWGDHASEAANMAVRVWDLALKSDPDDRTYYLRAHRACSLALAGQTTEARQAASKWIWQKADDRGFAALYVRLLALSGDHGTETVQWLDRAVDARLREPGQIGMFGVVETVQWGTSFTWNSLNKLSDVANDPSLRRFYEAQRAAIAELLRPKYRWNWIDGFVSDEVHFTNDSKFPLTNVKLSITFRGGAAPFSRTFQAEQVAPGQSISWKDLTISARRSPKDEALLACAENSVPFAKK